MKLENIGGLHAKGAVSLCLYLEGTPQVGEIIDVGGTHEDLQGVEDVGKGDIHALGLDAVNVDKNFGSVGPEA